MAYLLDSDVFIRAKNDHYGFDFCPAFWDWLERASSNGTVSSVEAVSQELIGGDDDLAYWVKDHRSMFLPVNSRRTPTYCGHQPLGERLHTLRSGGESRIRFSRGLLPHRACIVGEPHCRHP